MKINIIAVGKLKEDYLRAASAEYIKRLSGGSEVSVTEIDEVRLSDNPNQKEIDSALAAEAKEIRKALLKSKGPVVALCIEGGQISSRELANRLSQAALHGKSSVNFVIGSSFGLDSALKCEADFMLSMSQMTFPHQLARVMLLEQLYRATQINAGKKYHK